MWSKKTEYNGQKYRSKTEADVAKTLEKLPYTVRYEDYLATFNDEDQYLPDFYIEDIDLFIEVRGYDTEDGNRKIEKFANQIVNGKSVDNVLGPEDNETFRPDYLVVKLEETTFYEDMRRWGVKESTPYLTSCSNCGDVFFYGRQGSFQCRNCGYHEGDHHLEGHQEVRPIRVQERRTGKPLGELDRWLREQ